MLVNCLIRLSNSEVMFRWEYEELMNSTLTHLVPLMLTNLIGMPQALEDLCTGLLSGHPVALVIYARIATWCLPYRLGALARLVYV